IHKRRGIQGNRKLDEKIEQEIVEIIRTKYHDFGPLMASEKLREIHKIIHDTETIRKIMIRHKIWIPRKKKKYEYHPWRDPRERYGELQQFDGSYHNWFEGRNLDILEACLLLSVDDATGQITHAVFESNEGIDAVFRFWITYIKKHGIPGAIYLDKFSTYKINHKCAEDNSELMTQFQRACGIIDLEIIHANSPQAKGRVERTFKTLQDRLVKELRLHKIQTIAEANEFLQTIFIPWFNKRYVKQPKSNDNMHRSQEPIKNNLEQIFSKHSQRSVNPDYTIQFKNTWYQLKEIQPITVYKSDRVIVEQRIDGTIHIKYKDYYLNMFVLPERPKKQRTNPLILTTHRLNWKPA
ncbi:MAG: ISNCY family transposase, partial [Candidatus Nomurabacteria bacterium]